MNHLHYEIDTAPDDIVEVDLVGRANVLLMDDANYREYEAGRRYRYTGGYATTSPIELVPPRPGHWHLVVDLGGYPGTIRARPRVVGSAVAGE